MFQKHVALLITFVRGRYFFSTWNPTDGLLAATSFGHFVFIRLSIAEDLGKLSVDSLVGNTLTDCWRQEAKEGNGSSQCR